jgi:hypothetical protein
MDPITQQTVIAAAGAAAGGDKVYVDDVFSTYLTVGAGGQTITNGIDLATEGGMVWSKARAVGTPPVIHDTERGVNKFLQTVDTSAQIDLNGNANGGSITAWNNNGFTTGNDGSYGFTDLNGYGNYVHWTFRKAPGYFDVVTYTGNGTAGRTVAHSLGSVPGMMIIKCTSDSDDWIVYHRSTGNGNQLTLNTDPGAASTAHFNNTTPTSSVFTVGNNNSVNGNNLTYVAYVFAHDEPVFGTAGNESIIKCGSYTATNANGNFVNLGFEPQWVLTKNSSRGGNWTIWDNMRGVYTGSNNNKALHPNTTAAESNGGNIIDFNATGFTLNSGSDLTNWYTGDTFIYMAIRRPNKPPTAGTDVYKAIIGSDSSVMTTGFTVDFHWIARHLASPNSHVWLDRFRDNKGFLPDQNYAEIGATSLGAFESNDGLLPRNWWGQAGTTNHFFKRAPGFLDIVTYTGTGSTTTFNHNLTVVPELMLVKSRSDAANWGVYSSVTGPTQYLGLNLDDFAGTWNGFWNDTAPTSSVFTVYGYDGINGSGKTYINYLFATLPGISKVGSYPGTGNAINVDCGFSSGARFILIKRTDATGDWYLWNHADGIVSGNDPYRLVNDNDATQVTNTDYIDPLTSGFTVTSSAPAELNASGGTYLFLAIA